MSFCRERRPHAVATVAVLLCVSGAARGQFVGRSGQQFVVNGQPLKFIGFNVRGICHYGKHDMLPYSGSNDRTLALDYVESVGGRVIRVFAPYAGIGPTETGNRLATVLDGAWARGIRVIVVLTDFYYWSQSHPQGDSAYYSDYGGWILLNHTFWQSAYTANYRSQALYLAERFRDHPGVFAWELSNEGRDVEDGATFVRFCLDMAAQIRAVDPNHMIGAGLISYRNANITWSQAVEIFSSLDYLTSHNYNGSDWEDERPLAAAVNRPFFIEEAGFSEGDRPALTDADIRKWIDRGACGYMHWGLMPTTYDNGDGDRMFGIDRVWHAADWEAYRTVYFEWARRLASIPRLARSPAQLVATARQGRSPEDQLFTVSNGGGGTLAYTIADDVDWLHATPESGTCTTEADVITVGFETSAVPVGSHTATITIAAPAADGSPQTIGVTVQIVPVPPDFTGDGDVDVDDFAFFQFCFNGPSAPPRYAGCEQADFDGDGDVDVSDYGAFQTCFNGPARPPASECP